MASSSLQEPIISPYNEVSVQCSPLCGVSWALLTCICQWGAYVFELCRIFLQFDWENNVSKEWEKHDRKWEKNKNDQKVIFWAPPNTATAEVFSFVTFRVVLKPIMFAVSALHIHNFAPLYLCALFHIATLTRTLRSPSSIHLSVPRLPWGQRREQLCSPTSEFTPPWPPQHHVCLCIQIQTQNSSLQTCSPHLKNCIAFI